MALKPFAVRPLPFAIVSASAGTYASNPASNLLEFRHIGMTWKVASAASQTVTVDFGGSVSVDFVSLLLANAGSGTQIRVRIGNDPTFATQTYTSGAPAAFFIVGTQTTSGLYSSHLEIASPVTARYAIIEIFNHVGDFEAATLVIGKKLPFANYYSPGFEFGTEDLGDIELGRWGVPDETPGLIFRRWTGKFGWMSQSDMDTQFRPLVEKIGKRTPILFCMDPDATVNRQARTYFGWLKEPPYFTGAVNKFDRFESEFSIISMV